MGAKSKKKLILLLLLAFTLVILSINVQPQVSINRDLTRGSNGNVTFADKTFNLEIKLQEENAGKTFDPLVDYWIDSEGLRFGHNQTIDGTKMKYIISSTFNLQEDNKGYYYSVPLRGQRFSSINRNYRIDFSKECNKIINTTLINIDANAGPIGGTLLFDPECQYTTLGRNSFELIFLSNTKNNAQITLTDVSVTNSITTNITKENNFTHLTIGDNTIDFINDTNLVLYMPFDVDTSTTTYDYSANNNDGSLDNGVLFNESGFIGGSYTFDNNDDLIDAGSDVSVDNLAAITISAWFNPTSEGENSQGQPASKRGAPCCSGWALLFGATAPANGFVFVVDHATTTLEIRTVADVVTLNEWNHIVLSWDGTTSSANARFYVNGAEVSKGTNIDGSGSRVDDGANLLIVGNDEGNFGTVDGSLDEVMILNTTLTAAQITSLYNNQSSRFFHRGEQIFNNVSLDGSGGDNKINLTVNITENFDSMINVSFGNQSGDDYVYYPELAFTNNRVLNADIGTSDNFSIKFIFYAGNKSANAFITPSLENDLLIDSFTFTGPTLPQVINSLRGILIDNGTAIIAKFGKDGEIRLTQYHVNDSTVQPAPNSIILMRNNTDPTIWLERNGTLYLQDKLYTACTDSPTGRHVKVLNETNIINMWWNLTGSMCIRDIINQTDVNL